MADTKRARGTAASGTAGAAAPPESGDGAPHERPDGAAVCPVAFCPICTAVSTVNRAGPDVLEHLLVAGQQFLLALKAVVDARAADFDRDEGEDEAPMQRVDIG